MRKDNMRTIELTRMEPKINDKECKINVDEEHDYKLIYEEPMDDCQYI